MRTGFKEKNNSNKKIQLTICKCRVFQQHNRRICTKKHYTHLTYSPPLNIVATVGVVAEYKVPQGILGGGYDRRKLDLWRPPRSFAAETLCGVCFSMGGLALLCVLSYCSDTVNVTETFMLISYVECVLVCHVCVFIKGNS